MHPIPADLDLSKYVGAELSALVLGPFAITFDFYPETGASPGVENGVLRIVAMGTWELRDSKANVVADSAGYARRVPCSLNVLLTSHVESIAIAAPYSITFSFRTGHRLVLFTEIGGYESLTIAVPGEPQYVF
jgi:hypothetical protein